MTEILKAIMERRSPGAFSDKPIDKDVLLSLFEAARWAPSSFNDQPWVYIIGIRGTDDTYNKIFSSLVDFNKNWSKNAPVLCISLAHKVFERNKKQNPHAWHDAGMANQNISLQASYLGLAVHWMAGFSSDEIIKSFNVPEDFDPIAAFAIGFPSDKESEKESKQRERKPLASILFTGKWGNPLS